MGNYQSANIQALNDVVTNAITDVTTQNFTSNANSCQNINDLTVKTAHGSEINCAMIIDQSINQLCNLDSTVINTSSESVMSNIENKMDQLLQSTQSSVQGFLSAAASIQTTNEEIKNAIKNTIRNDIVNKTFTSCANSVFGQNKMKIEINGKINCPPGQPFIIDQNQIAKSAATCFAQNITNVLANNGVINDILQKMESTQSSKQGLDTAAFLIIGIVILVAIGFFIFKSGGSLMGSLESGGMIKIVISLIVLAALGLGGYYAYQKYAEKKN
jgi:hypothetical protein